MQKLLDEHRVMTVATNRPDGWPQATTVGYANEGLTLYFMCGLNSQKANNLARDDRVSLTIDHDTDQLMAITGLSMAGHAQPVTDPADGEKILRIVKLQQGLRPYRPRHLRGECVIQSVRAMNVTSVAISARCNHPHRACRTDHVLRGAGGKVRVWPLR
ncbi:pyridoxamine 5'-phosphate oxidase-related, FMN-binding protein [Nitrobacter hamburgensis X14]|uniref:Pyridoxamine 5'-phosphate oxidase-related, FMN-binding protein n=2 Tax=Nitrobacter hamburgensis TaxID=912 RepID=Q1QLY3_NITHX|nr:pyridoxamine 5'-phosphate oxidase-related, FMN-binding protein [Nitrobacter hamburgensis X14]